MYYESQNVTIKLNQSFSQDHMKKGSVAKKIMKGIY